MYNQLGQETYEVLDEIFKLGAIHGDVVEFSEIQQLDIESEQDDENEEDAANEILPTDK